MTKPRDLSDQIYRLLKEWRRTSKIIAELDQRFASIKEEHRQAVYDLGNFLTPQNIAPNEKVLLWFGSCCLEITYRPDRTDGFKISVREGSLPI